MKLLLRIPILALLVGCSVSGPTSTRTEKQIPSAPSIETGKQQYSDGQFDSAVATFRAILSGDPTNQAAYYFLNLAYQARYFAWVKTLPLEEQQKLYRHWEAERSGPMPSRNTALKPTVTPALVSTNK
ncbi:MAG: hypothetical protein WCS42_16000 [Verrucomicrobiota bacterium]